MAEQHPESVFDVLDIEFERLVEGGHRIDGRSIDPSFPGRPLRPQELKSALLHPSCDFAVRDAAWHVLIEEARRSSDAMTVALWMLQPGMRRAAGRLVRQLGVADVDIDSEFLTAVMQEIGTCDTDRPRLVNRLLAAGTRQVRITYGATSGDEFAHIADPADVSHPELALWRAVDAGVVTSQEAELIATTRLGSDTLRELAEQYGIAYDALQRRRYRAEARLAAWLSGAGASVEGL